MIKNSAKEKLNSIIDKNSFKELWADMHTYNFLNFKDYDNKLKNSERVSNAKEAVITGMGNIANIKCMIIIFESLYIRGSMGVVVGEKVSRAFKIASQKRIPVISITSSAGIRIQEGAISLMQMVKTSAAVYEHNKKGLLYISIISNPTLGGVTASFVSLADIIIGEKGAKFGFAGRRLIEKTAGKELPDDFQTVENAMIHGMIDLVVEKSELKKILSSLLQLHTARS